MHGNRNTLARAHTHMQTHKNFHKLIIRPVISISSFIFVETLAFISLLYENLKIPIECVLYKYGLWKSRERKKHTRLEWKYIHLLMGKLYDKKHTIYGLNNSTVCSTILHFICGCLFLSLSQYKHTFFFFIRVLVHLSAFHKAYYYDNQWIPAMQCEYGNARKKQNRIE